MGNWSQIQEQKKEKKEKNKVRREKFAGYFLNLSQLTFVALVLGGITPIYVDVGHVFNWDFIIIGAIHTVVFAYISNVILR